MQIPLYDTLISIFVSTKARLDSRVVTLEEGHDPFVLVVAVAYTVTSVTENCCSVDRFFPRVKLAMVMGRVFEQLREQRRDREINQTEKALLLFLLRILWQVWQRTVAVSTVFSQSQTCHGHGSGVWSNFEMISNHKYLIYIVIHVLL